MAIERLHGVPRYSRHRGAILCGLLNCMSLCRVQARAVLAAAAEAETESESDADCVPSIAKRPRVDVAQPPRLILRRSQRVLNNQVGDSWPLYQRYSSRGLPRPGWKLLWRRCLWESHCLSNLQIGLLMAAVHGHVNGKRYLSGDGVTRARAMHWRRWGDLPAPRSCFLSHRCCLAIQGTRSHNVA